MKFSKNNSLKIILIGAGGTGGYIAPHLYRIAYASGRKVQIIIATTISILIFPLIDVLPYTYLEARHINL